MAARLHRLARVLDLKFAMTDDGHGIRLHREQFVELRDDLPALCLDRLAHRLPALLQPIGHTDHRGLFERQEVVHMRPPPPQTQNADPQLFHAIPHAQSA